MPNTGLAPSQPVNKGLAFDVKPIYPQIISMLETAKSQKLEQDKLNYARGQAGIEYMNEAAPDITKFDDFQAKVTMGRYSKIQRDAIGLANKGLDAGRDIDTQGAVNDMNVQAQSFRSSNAKEAEVKKGVNDGSLGFYNKEAFGTGMLQEKQRAQTALQAKMEGKEYEGTTYPQYEKLLKREDLKDANAVSGGFWDEFEDNRTSSVFRSNEDGKPYVGVFDMPNVDIYKTDATGKTLRVNGMPVVVDEASDEMLDYIMTTSKGYDKNLDYRLTLEEGITKGQLVARDAKMKLNGVTISKYAPLPTDATTNAAAIKQQQRIEFIKTGLDLAVDGSPEKINKYLSILSKSAGTGVSFEHNPTTKTIRQIYTKSYFAGLGIDMTDPKAFAQYLKNMGAKILSDGTIGKDLPFDEGSKENTIYTILETAGHTEAEDRSAAYNYGEVNTGVGEGGVEDISTKY